MMDVMYNCVKLEICLQHTAEMETLITTEKS